MRGLALRRHLPREAQQVLHDHARALRLLQDHLQLFFGVVGDCGIFEQQIGKADDRGERIIHFMRDTGNELTQRRHFFRVHQFRLQAGGVGDVRHHHDHAIDFAFFVAHGAEADGKLPGRATAAEEWYLQIIECRSLQRALQRFGKQRTPRRRNHSYQRSSQ